MLVFVWDWVVKNGDPAKKFVETVKFLEMSAALDRVFTQA